MTKPGTCVRCREARELYVFRCECETHCMPCLEELAESALLAWLDLFSISGVRPDHLGGLAFGLSIGTLAETECDEAAVIVRVRETYRDASPLAQLIRHTLQRRKHGNENTARPV